MNKVCCITGHTTGLGKFLYDYFINQGWTVVGFSRSSGFNIEQDPVKVANLIQGCELFINNAYAHGAQLDLINLTVGHVKKMVVCGSVAADYPDPAMVEYSQHKKIIEDRCNALSDVKINNTDILLLKLTSSSYKDYLTVSSTINFWLDNPSITQIKFNVKEII
jgi:hypothetical protein